MHRKVTPEEEFEDPNDFYTLTEANRYNNSNGMKRTQEELSMLLLSFVKQNLNINSKILDIGCGTGFTLEFLKQEGYSNLLGIDPSIEMIKIAKQKKLNVMVGGFLDLPKLKLNLNYFDLIISVSALQWVIANKEDIEIKNIIKKIGKNIFDILSSKGKCIIQFYPNNESVFEVVASSFERSNFLVTRFIYNKYSIKKKKFILILEKKEL